MPDIMQAVERFFGEYEARFQRALEGEDDAEGTAYSFAACFVEANPQGVICGHNDDEFRAAIPQGNAFYRSIGTKSMRIGGLKITPIDERHAMVRVHWESRYEKLGRAPVAIDFDVVYLLQAGPDGRPRIFAYVVGDEQAVLREHGLLE
jgi:hypothetical protein